MRITQGHLPPTTASSDPGTSPSIRVAFDIRDILSKIFNKMNQLDRKGKHSAEKGADKTNNNTTGLIAENHRLENFAYLNLSSSIIPLLIIIKLGLHLPGDNDVTGPRVHVQRGFT